MYLFASPGDGKTFIKQLYLHGAIGGASNETNIFQIVSGDNRFVD